MTLSIRQFDKSPACARKAALNGPAFIAENGYHAFALFTIEEYRRLGGRGESIVDLLDDPNAAEIEFDPPRVGDEPVRPADFS